jgi:hypothetical protein
MLNKFLILTLFFIVGYHLKMVAQDEIQPLYRNLTACQGIVFTQSFKLVSNTPVRWTITGLPASGFTVTTPVGNVV